MTKFSKLSIALLMVSSSLFATALEVENALRTIYNSTDGNNWAINIQDLNLKCNF